VKQKKIIIAYVSIQNYTDKVIKTIVEFLRKEGLEVIIHFIVNAYLGDITKDF